MRRKSSLTKPVILAGAFAILCLGVYFLMGNLTFSHEASKTLDFQQDAINGLINRIEAARKSDETVQVTLILDPLQIKSGGFTTATFLVTNKSTAPIKLIRPASFDYAGVFTQQGQGVWAQPTAVLPAVQPTQIEILPQSTGSIGGLLECLI